MTDGPPISLAYSSSSSSSFSSSFFLLLTFGFVIEGQESRDCGLNVTTVCVKVQHLNQHLQRMTEGKIVKSPTKTGDEDNNTLRNNNHQKSNGRTSDPSQKVGVKTAPEERGM